MKRVFVLIFFFFFSQTGRSADLDPFRFRWLIPVSAVQVRPANITGWCRDNYFIQHENLSCIGHLQKLFCITPLSESKDVFLCFVQAQRTHLFGSSSTAALRWRDDQRLCFSSAAGKNEKL